jgi:hypothetical protein
MPLANKINGAFLISGFVRSAENEQQLARKHSETRIKTALAWGSV